MSEDHDGRLRIAVVGLGPIGLAAMRAALGDPATQVVAAVDIRDDLAGRDAGELAGIGGLGVAISPSLGQAGPPGSADVVLLCTGSHLDTVTDQLLECLAWDASVVSTCEELSYPWFHHPEEAARIDLAAQAAGRAVLGTGVNPGFAMDALALGVSGIVEQVDGVDIHRVVDAGTRRGPLQAKVGAGISTDEFERRKSAGRIGHVGLVESVAMLAAGFGWRLDRIDDTLEPAIATERRDTPEAQVPEGSVAGIIEVASGSIDGRELISAKLEMYVGAPDPADTVRLVSQPQLQARIEGLHGDVATAAIAANASRTIGQLPAGLRTMLDLQPLRARGGSPQSDPAPLASA